MHLIPLLIDRYCWFNCAFLYFRPTQLAGRLLQFDHINTLLTVIQHTHSVVLIRVTLMHCTYAESQAFQNQGKKKQPGLLLNNHLLFTLFIVKKKTMSMTAAPCLCSVLWRNWVWRSGQKVLSEFWLTIHHLASAWLCISGETDTVWRLANLLWNQ